VTTFDHHSPEFATGWRDLYAQMRTECPVAHSSAHGGFYAVTRYEDVRTVLLDSKTFVCGRDLEFPGLEGPVQGGVAIPSIPFRMGMMEMDGEPAHRYRRMILPWLAARSVEEQQPRLDELATWLLDRATPKGEIDIVDDLANPLPAIVTLDLLGLPLERWQTYATVLHSAAYLEQGSAKALVALRAELAETIEERRAEVTTPTCAVDALLLAEVDGRRLTTDEVTELVYMLLNGGVDTSTAVIAHLFLRLDEHPAERQELLAHPERIPAYIDDIVRWMTPGTGVARTVAVETELHGVRLHPGDRLFLALGGANNDPEVFPDPDLVTTEPREVPNLAFGTGAHRCVGASLAGAEIATLARHVLDRMPDYRIDRAAVVAYPTIPAVAGYIAMPATFAPSPTVGSVDPGSLPPAREFGAAARLADTVR
jgi:cytochrome P450